MNFENKKMSEQANVLEKIGDYNLIRFLGSGSYSTVYLAMHTTTQQLYAVKKIERMRIDSSQANTHQFKTEISIMQKINHPNILHLYDCLKSQRHYYLIVDYCKGGTLEDLLSPEVNKGGFEEEIAVWYLKQIMNGFMELVKHKIMHRDLKLENLLVHDDCIKIGDFGNAKKGSENSTTEIGSAMIRAPEIFDLDTEKQYTSKIDVWSLGVVFYTMLFGYNPFLGSTLYETRRLIETFYGENLPFEREKKEISEQARNFLVRTLQKDPKKRYGWPDCFKDVLFENVSLHPYQNKNKQAAELEFELNKIRLPVLEGQNEEMFKEGKADSNLVFPIMISKNEVYVKLICRRLDHERSVVSFFLNTYILLKRFYCFNKDFNTGYLILLLIKKAKVYNLHFQRKLQKKQIVCKFNEEYYNLFLESEHYLVYVQNFSQTQDDMILEFTAFIEANSEFIEMEEFQFVFNDYLQDFAMIDRGMKKVISRFEAPLSLGLELFASLLYCLDHENKLGYKDHSTNKVLNWEEIFKRVKEISKEEVESLYAQLILTK